MSIYQVNAVTSIIGTGLSRKEQALGIDRHTLSSDGNLVRVEKVLKDVENWTQTTIGDAMGGSDKFLKYDLLARNVLEEAGMERSTACEVGFVGKQKQLRVEGTIFLQVGSQYHGDMA
jgi:hypothetical protein